MVVDIAGVPGLVAEVTAMALIVGFVAAAVAAADVVIVAGRCSSCPVFSFGWPAP